MYMIFAYNAFDDMYFKGLTSLSHKFTYSQCYIAGQYLIAILGHPHKMIFKIENCMTPIPIFHTNPLMGSHYTPSIGSDKIYPPKGGGLNLIWD
jgi:hypothetical protein